MKFDWYEYLKLANELFEQQADDLLSNEAKLRSSISRAYYAVHCIVRNYMRDIEGDQAIPQNGTAHSYVIDQLRESTRKIEPKIERSEEERIRSKELRDLLEYRQKADYFDSVENLANTAGLVLLLAQRIISTIKSKSQITAFRV